jgi:DNA invertase Pin-like site-specific DNA recombinase/chorismate mutase
MKRALIFIAVSSQAQAADDKISLEDQEQLCREWCKTNGYEVIEVLSVGGYSRRESDVISALEDFAEQGITAYHDLREHWKQKDFECLVAYSHNRLGRSSTLHSYVVENTVLSGATIYLINGGQIDKPSLRFQIAMGGSKSAGEVDELVHRRRAGIPKRIARGLPSGRGILSHKRIYEKGKVVDYIVDPDQRRLLDDLATVFLEGYAYDKLEMQLYTRFGHINPRTGKRYAASSFLKLLYNPYFWGHAALGYTHGNQIPVGDQAAWVYDESIEPPPEVTVYRNSHEPAYTGDVAVKVKAEIRRREGIRGKATPRTRHAFSGLLYCNECSRKLTFRPGIYGMIKYDYWSCRTSILRKSYYTLPSCSQSQMTREEKIREYVHKFLEQVFEDGDLRSFEVSTESHDDYLTALQAEIDELNAQLDQLVAERLAQKHAVVREAYSRKMNQIGERLTILDKQLKEQQRERQASQALRQQQEQAVSDLRSRGVEAVMSGSPAELNQFLFFLLGNFRFFVQDCQIVKLKELP